ncbi:hypothetical protein [Neolewinella agarilytica]|uniref:Uncharacterized protein n=1 Tax=Neolewinella agarilytica TaxID=478744 RepID=A0A1H9L6M9_9BACT|nr:hypothetical protein [Neolewinella agarilytica]SER06978.1 hypothetical protein SAMN05444359_12322 [Neolewinella agarilytica]
MKKQKVNRKYNFPDADLYQMCMDAIRMARRDLKSFKTYGYDGHRLKGFHNRCQKFVDVPDDDELLGDQMIVTDKKYEASEKVKHAIRSIMTRVRVKFSNRTGRYRKFGTAKIGDMTDAQLLFCGRRVIRVARAQWNFLEETGLNESHLKKLADACQKFETAMNIQQDKVADRDIAVESRIDIGNLLYEEVIKVCEIGKDIWAESDRAKYEAYCIYESNNEQKKIAKAK